MQREIKSPAKLKVIEFIKSTKVGGGDEGELFSFEIPGNQQIAEEFIHQMRVELSRMRRIVRDDGKTVRMWKMMIEKIEPQENYIVKITLRRTISPNQRISNEVSDILEDLVSGSQVDVT